MPIPWPSGGIGKAVDAATAQIAKLATPVSEKDKSQIRQVATIAGNNDPGIGSVLADAFTKVGKNGVITVEEGRSNETYVDVVEGMQFDRGFLSPHFVTNQDDVSVEFEDCHILLFEEKISNNKKMIPLLEAISKAKKPLLIIAEDVEGGIGDVGRQQDARHLLPVLSRLLVTATAARRSSVISPY